MLGLIDVWSKNRIEIGLFGGFQKNNNKEKFEKENIKRKDH